MKTKLTPANIWLEKQNKPTYVARDLEKHGVSRDVTYEILLRRGVFKWFAVRRELITLKNVWKDRVNELISEIHEAKQVRDNKRLHIARGKLKMVEACRAEVRALCHSERWRAPDFDRGAKRFLDRISLTSEIDMVDCQHGN